jgi:hypothetical protein
MARDLGDGKQCEVRMVNARPAVLLSDGTRHPGQFIMRAQTVHRWRPPLPAPAGDARAESATPTAPTAPAGERAAGSATEPAIPPRAAKAWGQYRRALEQEGKPLTDPVAYGVVKKDLLDDDERKDFPEFDAWVRALREWRKATGQQKNKPRAGRAGAARSIVKASEL